MKILPLVGKLVKSNWLDFIVQENALIFFFY